MRYDERNIQEHYDKYIQQIANIYTNLDDDVLLKLEKKISKLEYDIKSYRHDLRVCEDEDLKLRDVIDEHLKFNHKHKLVIKVLKFIDKIIIKLPRVKIDWRRWKYDWEYNNNCINTNDSNSI